MRSIAVHHAATTGIPIGTKKKIKTLELKREGKAKEEILKVLSKGKYPISMEDIDEWLKDS
jgi:hypothetical protein